MHPDLLGVCLRRRFIHSAPVDGLTLKSHPTEEMTSETAHLTIGDGLAPADTGLSAHQAAIRRGKNGRRVDLPKHRR